MNLGQIVADEQETYPDCREKKVERTKSSLDGRDLRVLRPTQGIDGHVQR
jgi:hypothetical protein